MIDGRITVQPNFGGYMSKDAVSTYINQEIDRLLSPATSAIRKQQEDFSHEKPNHSPYATYLCNDH